MAYRNELVKVAVDDGVAVATFDAPPMNVITKALFVELARTVATLATDPDVRVVVFRSADPDFFLAHYDVSAILTFPTEGDPVRHDDVNPFQAMCETVRTMPKATIAEIDGRVGGGGSEFAASCDMRFGAKGKTVLNQMEVPLGILPGGSGTQRLPRLVGRGRAMEIILGGVDIDAKTAQRWGYLNRALPADELRPFVDDLARRIASFPPNAVALAKQAVLNAESLPLHDGMVEEAYLFETALRDPSAQATMRRFLDLGGQTREPELRMGDLVTEL